MRQFPSDPIFIASGRGWENQTDHECINKTLYHSFLFGFDTQNVSARTLSGLQYDFALQENYVKDLKSQSFTI